MDPITTVLVLLVAVAVFALVASKISIPYPAVMVLGGLAICFLPHLRTVQLEPDVIFKLFLPPLLFGGAWQISWKDFRTNLRPIALMAIGLVLFTTAGCAFIALHFIPGFTWASAFALGAILSPPDAIAVTALTKKIRLPRRLIFLLDGESLLNDASALVALRFAVAAAVTGVFSPAAAGLQFIWVSLGGIAIGLVVGWVVAEIHRRLEDSLIETTITFLTPYAAYLLAEQPQIHASGVLATVVAGLYLSWRSPEVTSADTRLQMKAVWEFVLFILNGLVFVLVGLGLPTVIAHLQDPNILHLIHYGLLMAAAVILLRFLWIIPAAYLPRRLFRRIRQTEPKPPLNQVLLLGWTGMRGVVSLAAALALPPLLNDGTPFPNRGLIIFLAFFIILVTLVFQSLTLPLVVRLLRVTTNEDPLAEERDARLFAAAAALNFLKEVTASTDAFGHEADDLRLHYENRIIRLTTGPTPLPLSSVGIKTTINDLRREALQTERQAILELRASQKIDTDLYQRLMADLDSQETHLQHIE